MNILVVGNGFDLAHGLPTKYGDFLEFIYALRMFECNKNWFNSDSEKESIKKRKLLEYFQRTSEKKFTVI